MHKKIPYDTARDIMLELIKPVETEQIPLADAGGRVLAEDIVAEIDMPPFARSPYDGYTFRMADVLLASAENPVTLRIIEEIPAGCFPRLDITEGTAAKILTGGPVPRGADTVVRYEAVEFTDDTVTLLAPSLRRDIIEVGEDVVKGTLLAAAGEKIDPALFGTLAAHGFSRPSVFKVPRAAIISTGSELVEADEPISGGMIRNSNRYVLEAACREAGTEPVNLGIAPDSAEGIANLIAKGLKTCDIIISTGGVSVGDYDLTPDAMKLAGVEIVVRNLDLKPGWACAYGVKDGKAVFCLSGNPTASITNFYAVVLPCLRKLAGMGRYENREITVRLSKPYAKISPQTRLLRGRLNLTKGEVLMEPVGQGNAMLHDMIGCDVLAVVPAGSAELPEGTQLKAYLLN